MKEEKKILDMITQNNKKYSLKTLIGVSALCLTLGFGAAKLSTGTIERIEENLIVYSENKKKHSELENVIGGDFNSYYKDEYLEFLEHQDAIELAKALGDNFSNYDLKEYSQLLESPNAVELIDILEDEFRTYALEGYSKLLKLGLEPKVISNIPSFEADDIAKALEKSIIPASLIPYFTHSPEEYSIEVAGKEPVFGTDEEKLKTHLKERLGSKDHCFRKYTDYNEAASQLDDIENINILYLIKGYVDFFDDEENVKAIFDIMEKDLQNHYSEEGGLVLYTDAGYRFMRFTKGDNKLKNLENNHSYSLPDWFEYIGRIGIFHFHATKEEDVKYCGPSGSAESDLKFFNGDIGILRSYNEHNPYEMDVVITKLKGDRVNADIYFRDVSRFILKSNKSTATILDLGIYEKPTKTNSP